MYLRGRDYFQATNGSHGHIPGHRLQPESSSRRGPSGCVSLRHLSPEQLQHENHEGERSHRGHSGHGLNQ